MQNPIDKYSMRINEITTIKPIQPITPAKARIDALKQQQIRAKDALKDERDRQQRTKATQKIQQAQQTLVKLNNNG